MLRILIVFLIYSASCFSQEYKEPTEESLKKSKEMIENFFDSVDQKIENNEINITEHKRALMEKGVNNNNFFNVEQFNQFSKGDISIKKILEGKNTIDSSYSKNNNYTPVMIFISFSMPEKMIKNYLDKAHSLESYVVLKGLYKDDFGETIKKLKSLTDEKSGNRNILIDPTLFERFDINLVPSFVLASEPIINCDDNGCPIPEYIKANGSITVGYFLEKVTINGNKKQKEIANNYLSKIEG